MALDLLRYRTVTQDIEATFSTVTCLGQLNLVSSGLNALNLSVDSLSTGVAFISNLSSSVSAFDLATVSTARMKLHNVDNISCGVGKFGDLSVTTLSTGVFAAQSGNISSLTSVVAALTNVSATTLSANALAASLASLVNVSATSLSTGAFAAQACVVSSLVASDECSIASLSCGALSASAIGVTALTAASLSAATIDVQTRVSYNNQGVFPRYYLGFSPSTATGDEASTFTFAVMSTPYAGPVHVWGKYALADNANPTTYNACVAEDGAVVAQQQEGTLGGAAADGGFAISYVANAESTYQLQMHVTNGTSIPSVIVYSTYSCYL